MIQVAAETIVFTSALTVEALLTTEQGCFTTRHQPTNMRSSHLRGPLQVFKEWSITLLSAVGVEGVIVTAVAGVLVAFSLGLGQHQGVTTSSWARVVQEGTTRRSLICREERGLRVVTRLYRVQMHQLLHMEVAGVEHMTEIQAEHLVQGGEAADITYPG
jgi:hypothetical protein